MKALTLCFCDLLSLFLNIFNAQRCWKGRKLLLLSPLLLWASRLWALSLIHCFFCLLIQVTNPAAFLSAMAGSWVGSLRCLTGPSQAVCRSTQRGEGKVGRCVSLLGGGWVASLSLGLPHGILLETFSLTTAFFTTNFQSYSRKVKLLQQPDPRPVMQMRCKRGGWASSDNTRIRLNFRP